MQKKNQKSKNQNNLNKIRRKNSIKMILKKPTNPEIV